MAKFATVDAYLAALDEADRDVVDRIRAAIRAGAPEAQEVISYSIPAFKLNGWLYYVSAHTRHYTLASPPPNQVWIDFADRLRPYKQSQSAIQFPKDKPIPYDLITQMTAAKAAENLGTAQGGGKG